MRSQHKYQLVPSTKQKGYSATKSSVSLYNWFLFSTMHQKITTATAKILKTVTETPKELIKLIKIIKTHVLPGKCLAGSWVDAPGGAEVAHGAKGFFLAAENMARQSARVTPLVPACLSSQCTL